MTRLLTGLWDDDGGAVVSVELVLIISILIFGMIPGYVALRNSGIALLTTLGNMANAIIPSFTFSGFAITAGNGMNQMTVLQVNGVQFNPTPQNLMAEQVAPIPTSGEEISPAP